VDCLDSDSGKKVCDLAATQCRICWILGTVVSGTAIIVMIVIIVGGLVMIIGFASFVGSFAGIVVVSVILMGGVIVCWSLPFLLQLLVSWLSMALSWASMWLWLLSLLPQSSVS